MFTFLICVQNYKKAAEQQRKSGRNCHFDLIFMTCSANHPMIAFRAAQNFRVVRKKIHDARFFSAAVSQMFPKRHYKQKDNNLYNYHTINIV